MRSPPQSSAILHLPGFTGHYQVSLQQHGSAPDVEDAEAARAQLGLVESL